MTHPDTKPEALRLADRLDHHGEHGSQSDAAAELRRLHAECESLTAEVVRLEPMRQRANDLEALRTQLTEARAEADECRDLRERMSAILTATAAALKGPPPPLTLHDWSGLPAVAESLRKDAERLDWLLLHVSGAEFRRIGVSYSGNARRAAIDAAMSTAPQEQA